MRIVMNYLNKEHSYGLPYYASPVESVLIDLGQNDYGVYMAFQCTNEFLDEYFPEYEDSQEFMIAYGLSNSFYIS